MEQIQMQQVADQEMLNLYKTFVTGGYISRPLDQIEVAFDHLIEFVNESTDYRDELERETAKSELLIAYSYYCKQ